jgi:transcriptional regulator with XRE-family HTH domain
MLEEYIAYTAKHRLVTGGQQSVPRRYRNNVKACRLRHGVDSQKRLAYMTGISRSVVSLLESDRQFLSATNALRIRDALGCRLDDLYELVSDDEAGGTS